MTQPPPEPTPAPSPPDDGAPKSSNLRVALTLAAIAAALALGLWAWRLARTGVAKPDAFVVMVPSEVPALAGFTNTPGPKETAFDESVQAAEQLGRLDWASTGLFFLLLAAVAVTYAVTVLTRVVRSPDSGLAKIAVGLAIVAFAGSMLIGVEDLQQSAWDQHEVPRVLKALSVNTGNGAATETRAEGDVSRFQGLLVRVHLLCLCALGAALVGLVSYAFANDVKTIAWGMQRLRNLLLCGGALLAVAVAVTNAMLSWPVEMLTAAGIKPVELNGATHDLVGQVASIGKAETLFSGARWSLVLAAGYIAVYALLSHRAQRLMTADGAPHAGAAPPALTQAMQDEGVKVDWKGALTRVLLILTPFLSATLVNSLKEILGG